MIEQLTFDIKQYAVYDWFWFIFLLSYMLRSPKLMPHPLHFHFLRKHETHHNANAWHPKEKSLINLYHEFQIRWKQHYSDPPISNVYSNTWIRKDV